MELLEQYRAAKSKLDAAKDECKAIAKQAFTDATAAILEAHPVVVKFKWNQYTPYFNDGDTCEFAAHTDYPVIICQGESRDEDDEDDEENEFCSWRLQEAKKEGRELTDKEKAGEAILDLLAMFSNEDYLAMFGDHNQVVVSREGIEVEEYSHD